MTNTEKLEIHELLCKICELLTHWDADPGLFDRRGAAQSFCRELFEYKKRNNLFEKG